MLIPALLLLLLLIIILAAVLLIRTYTFAKPIEGADSILLPEVDAAAVAERLAEAIRFPTVSLLDAEKDDHTPFTGLMKHLARTYPLVHKHFKKVDMGTDSLVLYLPGSEVELNPAVFTAHLDVVPADPKEWTHPPFDGVIAEGFVWGRGTLDCKSQAVSILEAAETLLKQGFTPQRTLFICFGHDEEIGGKAGAPRIVEWMKERGIQPEMVIDEGGTVADGLLEGVDVPFAMLGNSEKGHMTLEFEVEGTPGHSAIPPRQTAIGILAAALARLEAQPLPAHPEAIQPMMAGLGAAAPFVMQLAFANLWLFRGLVNRVLSAKATTSAAIRTTTALTIIRSGERDNILPREAKARVNFRLMPGDTIASVCEMVRKIIKDERVQFHVVEGSAWEASPVSPTSGPVYAALARITSGVFDGIPVSPYLLLGASDARHYATICDKVYRFNPFSAGPGDLTRVHGIDERLSVKGFQKMVQFFILLMQAWGE